MNRKCVFPVWDATRPPPPPPLSLPTFHREPSPAFVLSQRVVEPVLLLHSRWRPLRVQCEWKKSPSLSHSLLGSSFVCLGTSIFRRKKNILFLFLIKRTSVSSAAQTHTPGSPVSVWDNNPRQSLPKNPSSFAVDLPRTAHLPHHQSSMTVWKQPLFPPLIQKTKKNSTKKYKTQKIQKNRKIWKPKNLRYCWEKSITLWYVLLSLFVVADLQMHSVRTSFAESKLDSLELLAEMRPAIVRSLSVPILVCHLPI